MLTEANVNKAELSLQHPVRDKLEQRQILKRFVQITLGRLARIRLDLSKEQQLFLDALPVLLHTNHPQFPCFVSDYTPSGICRYQPSGAEIQKLQRLSPGFIPVEQDNHEQILSLFLSGYCGSIIQSTQQYIQVWVCHADDIALNALLQLRRKCDLIETWAKLLNLKVSIVLVDRQFRQFQQHASSTLTHVPQNFLQLDRLYRGAVMIAGRMPLWWLIPPEHDVQYRQYSSLLIHKGLLKPEEIIDFGPIPNITANELVELANQEFAQCFDQPYQACMSLLLIEVYISEFPDTEVLANQFKQAVYQDQLDLNQLDSYLMVFRRVEAYLKARHEDQRLALLRRCFYYQVGSQLSQRTAEPSWQHKQMTALVAEWGWSQDELKRIDGRMQWPCAEVLDESRQLFNCLNNSCRYIAEFARRHQDLPELQLQALKQVAKQLHACSDSKIGKLHIINDAVASSLQEKELFISRIKSQDHFIWLVFNERFKSREMKQKPPLYRAKTLIELLSWCLVNELIVDETSIHVLGGEHDLDEDELLQIIATLRQSPLLLQAKQFANDDAFAKPARLTKLDVFINVAVDVKKEISGKRQATIAHTAAFDYHQQQNNIIYNIEVLMLNSWGELICQRYEGPISLLNFLAEFIQMVPPSATQTLPALAFHSHCRYFAEPIVSRLRELLQDFSNCFYNSKLSMHTRFVLQMKQQFFILQYQQNQISFKGARSESDLIKRLGQEQQRYSPICLDRYALPGSKLAAVVDTMLPDTVQVFVEFTEPDQVEIYIADEKGSVCRQQMQYHHQDTFVSALDTFLFSTLYRLETQEKQQNSLSLAYTDIPIVFYQLTAQQNGYYQVSDMPVKSSHHAGEHFSIIAIAEKTAANQAPLFNIICGDKMFAAMDWGEDIYEAVARVIMAKRRSRMHYPCYISELELSDISHSYGHKLQTVDFLAYKYQLEAKINEALLRV
ncbi:MAG: class I adenylate cyclase [Pseudomonadales bacterium]|nr:class I adenylate cyclase [Pseudomonadales bacterium]